MEGVFIKSYFGSIVTKFLNKTIYKKTGFNPGIELNNLELKTEEGKVKADISVELSKDDFNKLMEVMMG